VSPSSGSGLSQTFTFVTSDPNGAADLYRTVITFASASNPSAPCVIIYIPATGVYLINDSITAWLGPVPLGTSNSLQNSQCSVNGTASSMQTSGNTRILNLQVSFKAPLAGTLAVYLGADTLSGISSPVLPLGTWTAPSPNQPPAAVSVSPSSGSGLSQTFTFVTSDPNGAADLYRTVITFASASNPSAPCVIIYIPAIGVYLINDSVTAWLGPVPLGTSSALQNSQCSVNGTASSMQTSGNTRTLNLQVTFKAPLAGLLWVDLGADNVNGISSPVLPLGTWTVP
jgi:hypothetical protein